MINYLIEPEHNLFLNIINIGAIRIELDENFRKTWKTLSEELIKQINEWLDICFIKPEVLYTAPTIKEIKGKYKFNNKKYTFRISICEQSGITTFRLKWENI